LKALYEAHALQWMELAAAASGGSKAIARSSRLSVLHAVTDRGPEHRPSKAA
jgi:hypothetical protein